VTATALPNGVKVVSTGAAASGVVGVALANAGTACGPMGAAFAAKHMAFKSANGQTDLAIQRGLELAGSTIHATATKTSLIAAVACLPESGGEAATAAAATAVGVARSPYIHWEFEETLKQSAAVQADLDALTTARPLMVAIEEAAYAGGPLGRRAATKKAVAAMMSTQVDDFLAAAVATMPITVVGVGFDHADILAYAAKAFASLGPRDAAMPAVASPFVPGGFAAKMTDAAAPGMAVALPVASPAMGGVLAVALGAGGGGADVSYSPSSSLLVAASSTASKADLLAAVTTKLDALTEADLAAAKLKYKVATLSKTGVDLAVALCEDPALLDAAAVDAVTLDACKAALAGIEPAFAVVAPADD